MSRNSPLPIAAYAAGSSCIPRITLCRIHLTAFGPRAIAGDNGANPATTCTPVAEGATHREETAGCIGQVSIYVPGFPTAHISATLVRTYVRELFTIHTVAGIRRGFAVKLNAAPQAIPFDATEGAKSRADLRFRPDLAHDSIWVRDTKVEIPAPRRSRRIVSTLGFIRVHQVRQAKPG